MQLEFRKELGRIKVLVEGKLWRALAPGLFGPLLRGITSFEDLQKRLESEEPKLALRAAVELLAKQSLTSDQLNERLTRRGFLPAIAKATVQRSCQEGWVDDAAWSRGYIKARENRGYGKKRINLELKQRGLAWPSDCPSNDKEVLKKLIAKRYASLRNFKEWQKAATALSRRGFDFEMIQSLLPSMGS